MISDLFGASGRRFLDALVAGERSPAALAALGDTRLKATRRQLQNALTGRFRDIHALEISTHLRLIDAINDEITRLDQAIGQQLAKVPRTAPACTSCGLAGGDHAPGCAGDGIPVLGLAERLDEITGVGLCNARVLIAELGTDPSQFPTPGHAAAWARLTPRTRQSGETARPGRTGKGNRYIRGALGQAAMAAASTGDASAVGALTPEVFAAAMTRWDRPLIRDVRRVWLQAQPGPDEAAFNQPGLAGASRTCSRRLRPSAVNPPPCAYRIPPAHAGNRTRQPHGHPELKSCS